MVYNYQTKQWGRDDRTIESALEYVSSGVTFDTWNTLGATFDTLPANVSFDSPLLSSGSPTPAFFDATHTIMTLDGVSTTSSFTTGDFGNDNDFMLLQRVKPVWLTKPAAANMVNFYKNAEGDTLVQDQTSNMSNSRFDVLRSARWHRFQFNLTGNSNLNQINAIYDGSGNE